MLKLTDVSEVFIASIIALIMEAVLTSEMSVYFDVTTWRYVPEDSEVHTHHRENLKSHICNKEVTILLCFHYMGVFIAETN
jgi:hypothetical protein